MFWHDNLFWHGNFKFTRIPQGDNNQKKMKVKTGFDFNQARPALVLCVLVNFVDPILRVVLELPWRYFLRT